ncbi:MAG: M15 family metallopeptidase [Clostridia bacterium]|nr:M15 family metallopeptidase [Clostridia bacterium]
MKKKQAQIRIFLLATLVSILGLLIILYAAFCRDGDYNKVDININQTENTTLPQEEPSELVTEPEENSSEVPEEPEEKPTTNWEKYDPDDVLKGENWALALINKKYPLDRNYLPSTASVIESSKVTADVRVAESYRKMYDAAKADGVILTPYSGYCSYQTQKTMYNNKLQSFLAGMSEEEAKAKTETRIEPAGCSENGAGLAVDIVSASTGFASTPEFEWLVRNAHRFGFVLRYPEDKTEITGMIYQPWHWRYVGETAATEMKENNLCLEEYLGAV